MLVSIMHKRAYPGGFESAAAPTGRTGFHFATALTQASPTVGNARPETATPAAVSLSSTLLAASANTRGIPAAPQAAASSRITSAPSAARQGPAAGCPAAAGERGRGGAGGGAPRGGRRGGRGGGLPGGTAGASG